MRRRSRSPLGIALALALATPPLAQADDLVVTRYDDPAPDGCVTGDCSLREAVLAANAAESGDRVLLSAGTYLLAIPGANENDGLTGDLNVREDLDIVGAGAPMTTIDGGLLDNVIEILGSGTDVTIRGVTIRGADGLGLGKGGSGNLLVEDCEIRDNGNSSGDHGMLVVLNASAVLRRTTVANNLGAGVVTNQNGTVVLDNTTVSGNAGDEVTAASGADLGCSACTIAADAGTAIRATGSGTNVVLLHSVVVGACAVGSGALATSQGANLESPGDTCNLTAAHDQPNVPDVELSVLDDHGGPTRTHEPAATSPAVDAAPDDGCSTEDQRHVARPVDGGGPPGFRCDAGAVERSATRPPTPIFGDGFFQGNSGAWSQTLD